MTRGRARELGSRSDGLKFSRSGERSRSPDRHRTVAIIRDLCDAWSHLVRPISIVRTAANRAEHGDCADHNRLDLNLTAQNTRGGTPRSRPDRTAIAERSSRDRDSFRAEPLPRSSEGIIGGSRSRSSHNRGPIAARLWSDRGAIVVRSRRDRGPIAARSWPDRGLI